MTNPVINAVTIAAVAFWALGILGLPQLVLVFVLSFATLKSLPQMGH